jgi:hypothetical protein
MAVVAVAPESRSLVPECPLCRGTERYVGFLIGDERFDECRGCGLLSHKAVGGVVATSSIEYGIGSDQDLGPELISTFFSQFERYARTEERSIGIIGKGASLFVDEARRRGFQADVIAKGGIVSRKHSLVAVIDLVEDVADPVGFVRSFREHLAPGSIIGVVTRRLVKPGWEAEGRILGHRQRYSFSDHNLQTVLWQSGFDDLFLSSWAGHHAGGAGWSRDQAIVFGRMRELRDVPLLSVVVPVYNEATTVRQVLGTLAAKEIPGVEMEVIVVESASTDGSRDIVLQYQDDPKFKIVLEEKPRGKGFAVRTGLEHAGGDVVLIQDADLEYDFLDYEMLIHPILTGRTAFVLGTRHAGHWKIRRFSSYFMADAMNVAHWFLVFTMNQLYAQSMTDPFTMFKVFRRDCLSGLEFECNRFDFDVELVCKLLRKGYTPLEIPVNYRARSFEEGKKVAILRDPPTWVRAMLKYRFADPVGVPGQRGKAGGSS